MASSSGWRWPAPWPRAPPYCWPTSRPATSTVCNREMVLGALRAAAERGAVVVLATHDPEAAAAADGELSLDAGEATWVRALS